MTQVETTTQVHPVFREVHRVLLSLKDRGYQPDFVVDVGASSGCWSATCQLVFAASRYVLIEPLVEVHRRRPYFLLDQSPQFEVVECAVSDCDGVVSMSVADDAVSSSLFPLGDRTTGTREVPCNSLLTISCEKHLTGRGILKLDVESSEYRALQGAGSFLDQIDIAIIETSVYRFYPETRPYADVLNFMLQHGFQYFDDAGDHRQDGLLTHKDVAFVRSAVAREQLDFVYRQGTK